MPTAIWLFNEYDAENFRQTGSYLGMIRVTRRVRGSPASPEDFRRSRPPTPKARPVSRQQPCAIRPEPAERALSRTLKHS